MRNSLFLLLLLVFLLLQAGLVDSIRVFSAKPDLVTVIIIIGSVFFERKFALFCSLAAGLFKDIFAVNPYGVHTLLLPLWSFLVSFISRKLTIEDKFVLSVFTFVLVFVNCLLLRFINMFSIENTALGIFLRLAFLESLYSALFMPLVMNIFNKLRLFETKKARKEFFTE